MLLNVIGPNKILYDDITSRSINFNNRTLCFIHPVRVCSALVQVRVTCCHQIKALPHWEFECIFWLYTHSLFSMLTHAAGFTKRVCVCLQCRSQVCLCVFRHNSQCQERKITSRRLWVADRLLKSDDIEKRRSQQANSRLVSLSVQRELPETRSQSLAKLKRKHGRAQISQIDARKNVCMLILWALAGNWTKESRRKWKIEAQTLQRRL